MYIWNIWPEITLGIIILIIILQFVVISHDKKKEKIQTKSFIHIGLGSVV